MSWPERMPPSNITSQRPSIAATISGSTEIDGIAQAEPRRDREAVAGIAPALAQHLQIEREHERGTLRGSRTIDELLIETSVLHEVLLKPERLPRRRSNVFDRANRHGAHA